MPRFLHQQKKEAERYGLKRHNGAFVTKLVGNSVKREVAESGYF